MPRWLRKELIVLGVFGLIGLLVLPLAVYATGTRIFDSYAGGGLGDFLSRFYDEALGGAAPIWFLIAAPYVVWQCLRLSWFGLRGGRRPVATKTAEPQQEA